MEIVLTQQKDDSADLGSINPKMLIVRPILANAKLETLQAILLKNNIDLNIIPTYAELYSKLSNPKEQISIVGLDLANMEINGDDVWSVIHTSDMILRSMDSDAIIIAGATMLTPPQLIKQFLAMSNRCMGIYPIGKEFTYDEKSLAIRHFMDKDCHIPKKISNIISPKKDTNAGIILTPRQEQIFNLIVTTGASNKMIARSLNISESTVKLHVASLLRKFCAKNRTQLALSIIK